VYVVIMPATGHVQPRAATRRRLLPRLTATRRRRCKGALFFATGGKMEDVLALSAFLGAALVGLAGHVQFGGYLDDRRWLRVAAFAAAFFLMAAILGGSLSHL
jgi:hypothetical protein